MQCRRPLPSAAGPGLPPCLRALRESPTRPDQTAGPHPLPLSCLSSLSPVSTNDEGGVLPPSLPPSPHCLRAPTPPLDDSPPRKPAPIPLPLPLPTYPACIARDMGAGSSNASPRGHEGAPGSKEPRRLACWIRLCVSSSSSSSRAEVDVARASSAGRFLFVPRPLISLCNLYPSVYLVASPFFFYFFPIIIIIMYACFATPL